MATKEQIIFEVSRLNVEAAAYIELNWEEIRENLRRRRDPENPNRKVHECLMRGIPWVRLRTIPGFAEIHTILVSENI